MSDVLTPTAYRQELKRRILKTAIQEFYTNGIKAVKMEHIAHVLSISKRTIYEIYEDKEELLLECIKTSEQEYEEYMNVIKQKKDSNVMDVLIEYYYYQVTKLSKITPIFFDDLQKYEKVVAFIESKRRRRDKDAYIFIQRGIKEGFYRPNVNYRLISKLARESVHYVLANKLYKEYDAKDIFSNIILLFVRGICTPKGMQMLEQLE